MPVLSPWNPLHLHHIAISLFLWYNVGIPLDTLPYLVLLACYHLRKNIPIIPCQSQCILKEITITSKHMNMCMMFIKCIVHPNIKHSWHLCCGKDKQSVLATLSSLIHPNVQCFCFCFVIIIFSVNPRKILVRSFVVKNLDVNVVHYLASFNRLKSNVLTSILLA